jgi:hypothetical protein
MEARYASTAIASIMRRQAGLHIRGAFPVLKNSSSAFHATRRSSAVWANFGARFASAIRSIGLKFSITQRAAEEAGYEKLSIGILASTVLNWCVVVVEPVRPQYYAGCAAPGTSLPRRQR